MSDTKTDNHFLKASGEKLNLVIAICAVLISAASFYATFIQADAAEKQVRAMTLPLLSFDHGNWLDDKNKPGIELRLKNGGVGPAILHSSEFIYEQKEYPGLHEWLKACCADAWNEMRNLSEEADLEQVNLITSTPRSVVLPGQGTFVFLTLEQSPVSNPLFQALDSARRQTTVRTCYCSLLDECYIATGLTDSTPVNECSD